MAQFEQNMKSSKLVKARDPQRNHNSNTLDQHSAADPQSHWPARAMTPQCNYSLGCNSGLVSNVEALVRLSPSLCCCQKRGARMLSQRKQLRAAIVRIAVGLPAKAPLRLMMGCAIMTAVANRWQPESGCRLRQPQQCHDINNAMVANLRRKRKRRWQLAKSKASPLLFHTASCHLILRHMATASKHY